MLFKILNFICSASFLEHINAMLELLDQDNDALDAHAEALIKKRELARQQGDWQVADDLRTGLLNCGILIFDSPVGAIWERISEQNGP